MLKLLPVLVLAGLLAGCTTIAGEYVEADAMNHAAYEALVSDIDDNALRGKHVVADAKEAWGRAGKLLAEATGSQTASAREGWGRAGSLFAQADSADDPAEQLALERQAIDALIEGLVAAFEHSSLDPLERNSLEIQAIETMREGVTRSFLTDEQKQLWLDNLAAWKRRIEAARKAGE